MKNTAIQKGLQDFCKSICGGTPISVRHEAETWAKLNYCFCNVQRKTEECGGERILGWQFIQEPVGSTLGILIAVHHAIWKSPEGDLVDITPCAGRTLRSDTGVMFLPDETATLPKPPGFVIGISRPSKVHALATTARVRKLAEAVRLKERQDWEEASGLLA